MSAAQDNGFELDPRLIFDTHRLGDFALSRVLLMNDQRFPWLVLVPRRAAMREWTDLNYADRHLLLDEVERVAAALQALHQPDKINIGALGNVVAQLHVHVIARFADDAAWPRPVWGVGERMEIHPSNLNARLHALRAQLHLTDDAG